MKTILFAISLMLFSISANALDLEIGAGSTHYKTAHDGLWYQAGYPHTEDLNSVPLSLGVSFETAKGIRYRVEYISLGWMYTQALWASDVDYYPGTPAKPVQRGVGRGSVSGAILSASRPTPIFGVPLYVEAGAFLYIPKWTISVNNIGSHDTIVLSTQNNVRVGSVLGFGVRYSGIDISLKYLGMQYRKISEEPIPPIYDHAYVLETKVYF